MPNRPEPNAKGPVPTGDDAARNRDHDMKPGSPPRPATEPAGAEGSSRSSKTATDPATGEPQHSGKP